MAIRTENFTAFTEVDPNSRISKTSTRVTVSNLTNLEKAYVYKDKGEGYFTGDFKHCIDIRCVSAELAAECVVWCLANAIGGAGETDHTDKLVVFFFGHTTDPRIYLRERYNDAHTQTSYIIEYDTTYYLTIERAGSTLTCKIYSDSGRTDLLATLSLELHSIDSYQYIYPAQSADMTWYADNIISCWCENLWLGIRIIRRIKRPPAIHDLGRAKSVPYNLGTMQTGYTLGKVKVGHNLGKKVK